MQVLNLPEVGESLWAWVSEVPGWVVDEDVWPGAPVVETADVVVAPPPVESVAGVPPLQP